MFTLEGGRMAFDGVLVVPCFNEESRFSNHYFTSLMNMLGGLNWTILFVNDGSSDTTEIVLREFANQSGTFFLSLEKNVGKGNAVRAGINEVLEKFDVGYVGYLDADGAFDVFDVIELIEISKSNNFDS
jgi:dolichyl-phosphate beta-glucosyltransferase